MPSPPRNQHRSSNGLSIRSSTGTAIRRGEVKISGPIPIDQGMEVPPPSAPNNVTSTPDGQALEGSWPLRTTKSEIQRFRNASVGYMGDAGRASAGPSLAPSSASKGSFSQRKSTGIRATLRRMFGSNKGPTSLRENRKDYHQSDPGNLTSIVEKPTDTQVPQNPPQPGGTVVRSATFASHAPGDAQRNSAISDPNVSDVPKRTRRNTLPSLVLSEQEAQVLAGPKDDLMARTWTQPGSNEKYLKRRSRSADALNNMISGPSSTHKHRPNRESEIAYWRKSVLENPMPSVGKWEEAVEDDAVKSPHDQGDRPQVQAFDFGLDEPGEENATVEERVNTLEIKTFDMEYAIAKLQGHDIPKPELHQRAPKRRSIRDLFPGGSAKPTFTPSNSSREPTSFLTSPDESPMPTDQDEGFRPDRRSQATTIRPTTARRRSVTRSPSPVRITIDQFDMLMGIIRREQGARRQLESQVAEVQRDLDKLRNPVYAEVRPVSYPTPSPEARPQDTPTAPRMVKRSPNFRSNQPALTQEMSRFSMSEVDSETDDSYMDIYETPKEDKHMFENPRPSPLVGV